MGSRLILILDDLLWVLTDSQLKAALHFIDSLGGLIEKATNLERKTKAARKLEVREYKVKVELYFSATALTILIFKGVAGVSSANISTVENKESMQYCYIKTIYEIRCRGDFLSFCLSEN